MKNTNSHVFDAALTHQVCGDTKIAATLMDGVEPFQQNDSVALLFHLLGEGDARKIDLLVNSAIVGMTTTYDREADNRDLLADLLADEVFKALAKWN